MIFAPVMSKDVKMSKAKIDKIQITPISKAVK
jgi:hypothetical protein